MCHSAITILTTMIYCATFITQYWGSGNLYSWTIANARAQFQPQKTF